MASVAFTPLYGVHSTDPCCYLLEVDEARILLDCGWNDAYDPSLLEPLRKAIADRIDLVLITHSEIEHLGALPYAAAKLVAKRTPVFFMSGAKQFIERLEVKKRGGLVASKGRY